MWCEIVIAEKSNKIQDHFISNDPKSPMTFGDSTFQSPPYKVTAIRMDRCLACTVIIGWISDLQMQN